MFTGKITNKIFLLKLSSTFFFRSSSHSLVDTWNSLESFLRLRKPTLLTGDFNICFKQNRNNFLTRNIEKLGFKQLVTKATHVMGGLIDHAYWKDESEIWLVPEIEKFSPYYSDHDAILITLKKCD